MKVVERFIINRNDLYFTYTEKLIGNFNNVSYRMYRYYYDDFITLTENEFYETYGDDDAITIHQFISYATGDILYEQNRTSKNIDLLRDFKILDVYFKKHNSYNPKIWGYKATLFTCLNGYNDILEQRVIKDDEEYDYEEDIKKLNEENLDIILTRTMKEDI